MKKQLFSLLINFALFNHSGFSQTSDSTLNQLLSINKLRFINKPLDSIIAILPSGYTTLKIFGIRNTARKLNVVYPNQVWIELHVRQFNFMNPVDTSRTWDISLMRKEDLYNISIYKGKNCFSGCPDY